MPNSPPDTEPVALEFTFNARNKSIVPSVFALEGRLLKKILARKPKVSLHDMEDLFNNVASGEEIQSQIAKFSQFYNQHDQGHLFFESLGRLLLEAASKENTDAARQTILLHQALDMMDTALKKSPKVLNIPVQSLIVSLYKVMGSAYSEHYYAEKEVHKEMMTMVNIKKDPNDFNSREKIIRTYLKSGRYFESLIHTAEYEKVMQIKSRSLYRQKIGELAFRKAMIFQAMLDRYLALTNNAEMEDEEKNHETAKLNTFVQRFNQDNNRVSITPLKGYDTLSIRKTLRSMVLIANSFYAEAAQAEHFTQKYKAHFHMARNNHQFDNQKMAFQNLSEGIRVINLSRLAATQKNEEKIKFMEYQVQLYTEQELTRKAEEIQAEITTLRKEIRSQGKTQQQAS